MATPMFDFAQTKLDARRVVQSIFGVEAWYSDSVDSQPRELRARCHNRKTLVGELNTDGYAEVVDSVDRIVFVPGDTPGLVLRMNGQVRFPSRNDETFVLRVRERSDGPLEEVWQVVPA
jgi:hypothetical protein